MKVKINKYWVDLNQFQRMMFQLGFWKGLATGLIIFFIGEFIASIYWILLT